MKLTFQGSLEEFRAVFGALDTVVEVSLGDDEEESDELPAPLSLVMPHKEEEQSDPVQEDSDDGHALMKLSPGARASAWAKFKSFCAEWVKNFDVEGAEQPDRLSLMLDLGTGNHTVPVLVLAYEIGSLQRLVEKALTEEGLLPSTLLPESRDYLDYLEKVTGHMLQISHMGFPDLVGTYDYSTKWKRTKA